MPSPLYSRTTVPRAANIDDFENLPVPTGVPGRPRAVPRVQSLTEEVGGRFRGLLGGVVICIHKEGMNKNYSDLLRWSQMESDLVRRSH